MTPKPSRRPRLGQVRRNGFDASGYERRDRLEAIADCPKCGQEVECWSDTEEWRQGKDGRWHHLNYGGAMGVCVECDLLIADMLSDGYRVIDLKR